MNTKNDVPQRQYTSATSDNRGTTAHRPVTLVDALLTQFGGHNVANRSPNGPIRRSTFNANEDEPLPPTSRHSFTSSVPRLQLIALLEEACRLCDDDADDTTDSSPARFRELEDEQD
jgi:hypothetical protein